AVEAAMALAGALERLQEEAICPICLEYMSEPVSVDCGHNFCRGCIAKHCQEKGLWADGPFSCPQCRASCHRSGFRPNRQLANIVESIRQLGLRGGLGTEPGTGTGTPLCAQHDEHLKLFCEEDEEAICVVCRESLHHRLHTVYPIEEAAQVYKVKLQKSLEHLAKEVEDVRKRESAERMKTQECKAVKKKRERIVSEFGKLHRLLADEEKLLLQKLEEEEKRILLMIDENLARLVEQKSLLEELILEIKEKTQQPADGLLKKGIKPDPSRRLAVLWALDTAHGHHSPFRCEGVKFQSPKAVSVTLKENYSIPEHCLGMREMLKKFKVDVTLDPETAHPDLTLSEDRKSVRRGGKKLLLSLFDNPKRFGTTPAVLGSQVFFSGRCYWEVQVGDKPEWGLGLCRESASRKGNVLFSPDNGYWLLRLQNGGNYEALTSPVSPLTLNVRPRRIGIFLDYEEGEISFYNVSDRSHVYTFTDKFSGNLRPLFFLGAFLGGRNAEPLVISWVRDTQGTGCIIL
ncbi:TRI39 ligase, partial [Circaetus pectoralis]|nr:TRI39 ligase [Circaetus pectoralis]